MRTVRGIWILLFVLHAAAAVTAWNSGWLAGFLVMMALHLALLATTLWPGSTPFCPARQRFDFPDKSVVLTIDDGPCADTPAMLDLLDRHQAKAVFFLIGERAAAAPDLVQAMTARGHQVENHTFTHPATRFWSFGPGRQRREIQECGRLLTTLTGQPPAWFRAPAGFRNPFTGALLRELKLGYLGWTARGFDTSNSNISRILAKLRRGLQPGGILLIHQGHPHSVALLTALLELLQAEGWKTQLPPEMGSGF